MRTDAPDPVLLTDRMTHWAETTPDAPYLAYRERRWTFGELDDRVRRVAGGLRALGLVRGDVVAFLDKNHPACVEVTMAAAYSGMATAIVNWRLADEEIAYTLNDSGARVLFVGAELASTIARVRGELTALESVIEVAPDGDDEYEAWLASYKPAQRCPELDPEDVCLVMYSSGTTGRPKGVMLSHRAMVAHTVNANESWLLADDDVRLIAMPLFHVGGTSYAQFAIHSGRPSIMVREPDGPSLVAAIMAGATSAFLVPAVAQLALSAGEQAVAVFSRLRLFIYGAAPMPPALLRRAMQAWPGTRFMQVYGLTEVCGVVTELFPADHLDDEHPERLLSAGMPVPSTEVRVVDPETLAEVPPGGEGELWFRTPQLMSGFLNLPDETAEMVVDGGWLRTGDIGRFVDGYVYVEDRYKDMIVTGGENVYSTEVERVLNEHPDVVEAAVIGVPDPTWGEAVKAIVVTREGVALDEPEVIAHARRHLAHFKAPRSVEFVTVLPRNPGGKVLKRDLREPYWRGSGRRI